MKRMKTSDIHWNEPARAKILDDADRVLQEAVVATASSHAGEDSDAVYAELNRRLKDRFIDYEPGPDVRTYADAIVAGEIETESQGGAETESQNGTGTEG